MTRPPMAGNVMRRPPVVTELDELNHATTARWRACEHRYSDDRMIQREVWMHVCLGCSVPVLLDKSWSATKRQMVKDSHRRGSIRGAQTRQRRAAA